MSQKPRFDVKVTSIIFVVVVDVVMVRFKPEPSLKKLIPTDI